MTQSLASRHRPLQLASYVGQHHVTQALARMLAGAPGLDGQPLSVPQVLLIAGPSGTGKTTLARILAAASMCGKPHPGTGEGCQACADCKAAQAGIANHLNFMFIDGSGSGLKLTIEEDLTQFAHAKPLGLARRRVCIADEAQAMSKQGREALLTLTENLPASTMLIYTTTEPEAIDVAIRSRATCLYLHDLEPGEMTEAVLAVVPQLADHQDAIMQLAGYAQGSMRRLWGYIEQLVALGEAPSDSVVAQLVGGASAAQREELWEAIAHHQLQAVRKTWQRLIQKGQPGIVFGQLIEDLLQQAASNPKAQDWATLAKVMGQAQLLKDAYAYELALLTLAAPPVKPSPVELPELASAVASEVLQRLQPGWFEAEQADVQAFEQVLDAHVEVSPQTLQEILFGEGP